MAGCLRLKDYLYKSIYHIDLETDAENWNGLKLIIQPKGQSNLSMKGQIVNI